MTEKENRSPKSPPEIAEQLRSSIETVRTIRKEHVIAADTQGKKQ